VFGTPDLEVPEPPDPGSRGSKGPFLGPFLDPLLGQSGSKRPVVLKKGVPKRGQKGVILGSRDPEDPGSGGPRTSRSGVLGGQRGHFGTLLGSFLDPLLGQNGSKRLGVLKKGCTKKGSFWGPETPRTPDLGVPGPPDPGSQGQKDHFGGVHFRSTLRFKAFWPKRGSKGGQKGSKRVKKAIRVILRSSRRGSQIT
jgi:hypothetical protein